VTSRDDGLGGPGEEDALHVRPALLEALRVDAAAAAVLVQAVPGNGEVAQRVHAHAVGGLVVPGCGVDADFPAQSGPRGVGARSVNAEAAAVLPLARPGDHEVAGGVEGRSGKGLVAGGGAVDGEGGTLGLSGGVEAPAIDLLARSGRVVALPGDDEG